MGCSSGVAAATAGRIPNQQTRQSSNTWPNERRRGVAIEWLKRKHRTRKPTQASYRPRADNGDQGTKHLTKHKSNEKERAAMYARQPRMTLVLDERGRKRMQRA